MSFGVSGIRILSFASIIRHMTYCVKFFQKNGRQNKKENSNFLCIKVLSGGAFVV